MEENSKTMFRAAASFFSGTMLSRVTGMVRDMVMAFSFGTDASIAAFFVAFRFAHLLRRLFGEGTLQSAFVPQYEEMRRGEVNSKRAISFFIDLYLLLFLVLALIIFIVGAATWLMLEYEVFSFTLETKEILNLSLIMLPSLLFICLAGLNTAFLQCEKSYFIPASAPIAFNLCWILGALYLSNRQAAEAMPTLALFIVAACICQWIVMLPKVCILLKKGGCSLCHFIHINPLSKDLLALWKPFTLGIIGIGAAQINSCADALFARYAESAGPAYLWYAIRLQQLPIALFGVALSGALLPPLTRAFKGGEYLSGEKLLSSAIYRTMLLIAPITICLFVLGRRSIALIYGYGDFDDISTSGTFNCLIGYGVGLVPMTLILIVTPLFFAQSDYRIPTIASSLAVVLNILLNALLVICFHLGAFSIALATSICAWVNLIYLLFAMKASSRSAIWQGVERSFSDTGLGLLLALVTTLYASSALPFGESFFEKAGYLFLLAVLFLGLLLPISLRKRFSLQQNH